MTGDWVRDWNRQRLLEQQRDNEAIAALFRPLLVLPRMARIQEHDMKGVTRFANGRMVNGDEFVVFGSTVEGGAFDVVHFAATEAEAKAKAQALVDVGYSPNLYIAKLMHMCYRDSWTCK